MESVETMQIRRYKWRPFFMVTKREKRVARRQRSAFTLMEVLLVLAILLVIKGMVVPKLLGRQKSANIDATKVSIEGLSQALKLYALDHEGNPPTSAEGIKSLLEASKKDARWKGPYLEKIPLDAWGVPLQYRIPGVHNPQSFDIQSSGAGSGPRDH